MELNQSSLIYSCNCWVMIYTQTHTHTHASRRELGLRWSTGADWSRSSSSERHTSLWQEDKVREEKEGGSKTLMPLSGPTGSVLPQEVNTRNTRKYFCVLIEEPWRSDSGPRQCGIQQGVMSAEGGISIRDRREQWSSPNAFNQTGPWHHVALIIRFVAWKL